MKKLYLAFVLVLLLVLPIVSADVFEFDNVKEYNEELREVSISNSFARLWTLDEVARIRLVSEPNVDVFPGKNVTVAELVFSNFDRSYNRALKDMKFYDVKSGFKEIDRDFGYKYAVTEVQTKNIYEKNCVMDNHPPLSGIPTEICSDGEIIGTEEVEVVLEWVEFTRINELPNGDVRIRIFTDVYSGDHVDWIPTFFGVEIPEWATWTDSFHTDLWAYYSLNESTGNFIDNTGNTTGNEYRFDNEAISRARGDVAINNGSVTFPATGDYINVTDYPVNITNMSFNIWVYDDDYTNKDNFLVYSDQCGSNTERNFWFLTSTTPFIQLGVLGAQTEIYFLPSPSEWHMFTVAWDGTTVALYMDGALNTTFSRTGTMNAANASISLGNACSNTQTFNTDGNIDEFAFWTRNITASEVTDLWNAGAGIFYNASVGDPTVTLSSPVDNFKTASSDVTFNCSATDNSDIVNLTIIVDGVDTNVTTFPGASDISVSAESTESIADGAHTWTCRVEDEGKLGATAATRSFSVDTIFPSTLITSPNETFLTVPTDNRSLNWTVTETNIDSCLFYYNGVNQSVTCGDNNYSLLLNSENKSIIFYANDTFGNSNTTTTTWSYSVVINSETVNQTSYETSGESFYTNVTRGTGSSLDGYLWYNGTRYTPTEVEGSSYTYSYNFGSLPLLSTENKAENRSYHWEFVLDSTTSINSSTSYQYVMPMNLTHCKVGTNMFMNVSFKDEKSLVAINASMQNTWTYYLGDGTLTRSNTYTNTTSQTSHAFCADPIHKSMVISGTSTHEDDLYPQREYNYANTYTNSSTNITVYLLKSTDGIYTTFQVLSTAEQPISGVTATVNRTIDGSNLQIDAGVTGDDGGVTFWVNPDGAHTFVFSKAGYTSVTKSLTPSQSQYTVYLGGGSLGNISTLIDYTRGVTHTILPYPGSINYHTNYTFQFNLTSTYWDLDEWGYIIKTNGASGNTVRTNSSTIGSGGSLTSTLNSGGNSSIDMYYYWVANGTYVNSSSWHWKPINITSLYVNATHPGYGLKNFFTRWGNYTGYQSDGSPGIFGSTDLTKYILIFLLMFGLVGMITYSLSITEPAYLLVIIASVITLFDGFLKLLPGWPILTIFTWFMAIMLLWRYNR